MAKKKEMTIDDLALIIRSGLKEAKKDNNDLAALVMDEFGRVREEIKNTREETRGGFFEIGEHITELKGDVAGLKKDMIWVKDILEAHTKMLKDLDEEKVFVVHRTDRIENDVEILKKHLKIA